MTRDTADALIRNLKLLNAKERDHLMRLAYLGQSATYDTASLFLAPELDAALRGHALDMGLAASAKCMFAGMDYHLDWLYAALWMAHTAPDWTPPATAPRVPMGVHAAMPGIDSLYTDFRPVTGSQEDIDFLAVFGDGCKLAVLLIEAKGSAAFNKVQLARKLIRLDRILVDSGATSWSAGSLAFRLILAAPKRPTFDCCIKHAKDLPEAKAEEDKFRFMREALEQHLSGIGQGLHFLQISGFPEQAYAVERVRTDGAFTDWTLKARR
jgi:hypothetical protein